MNPRDPLKLHVGYVVDVNVTSVVERMIQVARKFRKDGSTKIAAIRQIYPELSDHPREAIWYAFMHGADLSSRGAVTYYYIMRRETLETEE